jgi:hypothetical protein
MTQEQIRQMGIEALIAKLGPAGMVRFLQQFDMGSGDYTKERHTWLGKSDVKTLAREIRRRRRTLRGPKEKK